MCSDEYRCIEVEAIEDVRPGVHAAFVVLVIDEQVALVLRQPSLVGVGRCGIPRVAQHERVGGIGDVHDGDGVLVEAEGDLLADVGRIRTAVVHDLGVVGVAVLGEAADERRAQWVGDVEDVQATTERVGTHRIGAPTRLVDGDVVRIAETGIVGVLRKGDGRVGYVAQPCQIEHLQPVTGGLRNDEGMVRMHLHVPPQRAAGMGGQGAEHERCRGGRDVHESRGARHPHDGVFLSVLRIGPAPQVLCITAPHGGGGDEAHEVDLITGIARGSAPFARGLCTQEEGEDRRCGQEDETAHVGFWSGAIRSRTY